MTHAGVLVTAPAEVPANGWHQGPDKWGSEFLNDSNPSHQAALTDATQIRDKLFPMSLRSPTKIADPCTKYMLSLFKPWSVLVGCYRGVDNSNRIQEQTSQWLIQHHSHSLISAVANIWKSRSEPTTLKFYGNFRNLLANVTGSKNNFQFINSDCTSKDERSFMKATVYSCI